VRKTLSSPITEEASKLRSNAASSTIQNVLNVKQLENNIANFNIESSSSSDLSEKEFKVVIGLNDYANKIHEQLILNIQLVGSAIAASNMSINISNDMMTTLTLLNDIRVMNNEIQKDVSNFDQEDDFTIQKKLIETTYNKIVISKEKSKQVINELISFLFK